MDKIFAFLKLIRATNLLLLALSITLFYWLILVPVHQYKLETALLPFTTVEFLLFVCSVVFIAAAGNIINDYFDFELDRAYKPQRPLAKGVFSLDTAIYLHAAFALGGIALGFYLGNKAGNFKIGYLYIICVLLLYVYSAFLKKIPLAGNLVVAALTGFVFLLLMMFELQFLNTVHFDRSAYVLDLLMWQVKFYGGFAFLTNLAREIVKDIEDKEGDAEFNIQTLAVAFGETSAKIFCIAVLVLLLGLLWFFMRGFIQQGAIKEFSYLTVAVVVPVLISIVWLVIAKNGKQYLYIGRLLKLVIAKNGKQYLYVGRLLELVIAKNGKQYLYIGRLLKVVMLLGILSIPAFYLFNLSSSR